MAQKIKPVRWLLEYVASLPFIGLPLWYIVGYVFLRVLSHKLIVPLAYLSGLHLVFGPLFLWARLRADRQDGSKDFRPLTIVAGAFSIAFCVLIAHYAARLGFVSEETARGYTMTVAVGIPICLLISYYILTRYS